MHTFGEKMSNTKIKELTQEKTKEIVDAINQIENKEIMVNVSRAKIKPDAEFVFLFIENVYSVMIDKQITKQDLLVLMAYAKRMSYGNQIAISQQDIADELQTYKANVSNSVKKLTQRGIFYKEGRSLYMNWKFLAKGNLSDFIKADKENHAILNSMKSRKTKSSGSSGFTDLHFLFFLNAVVFIISRLLFC